MPQAGSTKRNYAWAQLQRMIHSKVRDRLLAEAIIAKLQAAEVPQRLRLDQLAVLEEVLTLTLEAAPAPRELA